MKEMYALRNAEIILWALDCTFVWRKNSQLGFSHSQLLLFFCCSLFNVSLFSPSFPRIPPPTSGYYRGRLPLPPRLLTFLSGLLFLYFGRVLIEKGYGVTKLSR